MDYIREELLRQQEVWSVLLLGGHRPAEQEEPREHREDRRRLRLEEQIRRGTSAAAEQEHLRAVPKERTHSGEEKMWAAVTSEAQEGRERRKPSLREEGVSLERERAAGEIQLLSHVLPSDRAEQLSRAFQRDARRYDGGFSMY